MRLAARIRSKSSYCLGMATCIRVRLPERRLLALGFWLKGAALWIACPYRRRIFP